MPRQDFISEDIVRELQDSIAEPVSYTPEPLWPTEVFYRPLPPTPPLRRPSSRWAFLSLVPWVLGAVVVVVGLLYVSQYGLHLKARVVQEGNAAILNLTAAKDDVEQFRFIEAQNNFSQASDRFDKARDELGLIGTFLAKLPGGGKIQSAANLINAGQLISDAGTLLAKAVTTLSGNPLLLDLSPMREVLTKAGANIHKAAGLLASVDASVLPAESRQEFTSFMQQLPAAQALIGQGTDAVTFLSSLIGVDQPRRYLLLFQNSSELRPTGGFPGSYGLLTFEKGQLKDMTTDDIYNPDGQIKQLVVPPLQLQGITPTWGMRDANWFIDFPTSARKVAEYYRKGGGTAVDGVFTLRPEIISDLLRITGPVSLPQYDMVLTAENFIPTIQLEVESQKTAQPKKVIMDLAPLILAKLAALPPDQWGRVLQVFSRALAQRDIMLYANDPDMQKYIVAQGWDGGVKETSDDYLMVNVSNIKGAKQDAVTDTSTKLESWLENGTMAHRLTVTRQNNGGQSEYAFYNKTNYSYVRVLVPDGSSLRGITGNDRPIVRPMIDYAHTPGVIRDPDLVALESGNNYNPVNGAMTYQESGKTGFGFWMKIEPGKTESVQLEYVIPARAAASDYRLLVQRQPGLDLTNFEFTLQKHPADGGASGVFGIGTSEPTLVSWPDSWRLDDPLKTDLNLVIHLQ